MNIYPAIDLMDGEVVRLYKGDRGKKKVYGDPLTVANEFSRYTDKVHIVDLNGAFEGRPRNLEIVDDIIRETGLSVQIGGGFRDHELVSEAYSIGVENVIIGTKAFDEVFLKNITDDFDGVTVSLDARVDRVMVEGWREEGILGVKEAYDELKHWTSRFVYTQTEKDGTLTGVGEIERFWEDDTFIYAGGVTSLDDLADIKECGFHGAIIGKALYEGKLDLEVVSNKYGD